MMMRALWIHASYPGDSRQCSIGTRERFFHVPTFKGVVHLIKVAHCLKGDGTRNPPLQGALGNPYHGPENDGFCSRPSEPVYLFFV